MAHPAPVSDPIALEVGQLDLIEALRPFFDLLGVNENQIYGRPGITIGDDRITFAVPAISSPDEWGTSRPHGRPADVDPQSRDDDGRAFCEVVQFVTVDVIPGGRLIRDGGDNE